MREFKGNNLLALPNSYIVIDTETTGLDYSRCHIIEISAIKYEAGAAVDSFSTLVQPPLCEYWYSTENPDRFHVVEKYVDDFISDLTGITNEMLSSAPSPTEVMPKFLDFIGDAILIGHNVNFDINFLYDAALEECNFYMSNNFVDTMRLARKIFPELEHHRLADIAQACGQKIETAHRAYADCAATANCYAFMRNKVLESCTEAEFVKRHTYNYARELSSVSATNDHIDTTNPIYGKTVVFTGALSSMSRKDAFQIVADLGGSPSDSVTKKTNFLVIGTDEYAQSVAKGKTNKMLKAEQYQAKGLEILTLSEASFFDMISDYR